jgi:hypothetical protein
MYTSENNQDEEYNRKKQYLEWLRLQNLLRDSIGYNEDKKQLIQIVEKHKLHFYLYQKYRLKKRITQIEVQIIAIEKGITKKAAKEIADDFNLYMNWLSCSDVVKACNKLQRNIRLN